MPSSRPQRVDESSAAPSTFRERRQRARLPRCAAAVRRGSAKPDARRDNAGRTRAIPRCNRGQALYSGRRMAVDAARGMA